MSTHEWLQHPGFGVPSINIPIVVITLLGFSAFYGLKNIYFHSLSHVPGPMSGKVLPFWTTFTLWRRDLNTSMAKLHEQYGPVVRVGPNELSFAKFEAHNTIYREPFSKSSTSKYFSKDGTIQDAVAQWVFQETTLGNELDRDKHRRLRQRMAPAFSMSATMAQQGVHSKHFQSVIAGLDSSHDLSETTDLTTLMDSMVWDIVSELCFGEPLIAAQRHSFARMRRICEYLFPVLEMLNSLFPWLERVLSFLSHYGPVKAAQGFLIAGKLQECIERQTGRHNFLTAIMGEHKPEDRQLTWAELYNNAAFFVVAGYMTNEISHSALMYQLLNNPECMARLQQELRTTFQTMEEITAEGCLTLPFLNACINESIRLLPPVAGKFNSRRCPGAHISDVWVPEGTQVYIEYYTIQRSPDYWSFPDEYRPDRFLDRGEDSEYHHDNMDAFRPFSLGPRNCLGQRMALQSLRLSIAKVLWKYDLKSEGQDFNWERDCGCSAVWSNYRLPVRVTKVHG